MMRSTDRPLWTAVSIVILLGTSSCYIVKVSVPELADLRHPVTLSCIYDTGEDAIFSVKWYKDDQEFFRYMPNHMPELLEFPVEGMTVRRNDGMCRIKNCTVILENITPSASGTYTCEVSTEAPTFRIYGDSLNMTVAAPALKEPELEGLKGSYSIGDTLDVTCKTSPSLPPATINIYINHEEVDEKNLSRVVLPVEDKFFTSMARLQIALDKKHFMGGIVLKVKCLSTVMAAPSSVRSITGSATLGDSQLLHNQKLLWSNSSGRSQLTAWIYAICAFNIIQYILKY